MNLSFIKLDIGILNDTKIKLIRKMPEGSQLVLMWIGMLCLAMKSSNPGELLIAPGLPFNEETLAFELDLPLDIVRLGLQTFENLKMVTFDVTLQSVTVIFITNFATHQSLDKIQTVREQNRLRVQKHRKKQRLLLTESPDVMHYAITCNATDKIREDKNRIDITARASPFKENLFKLRNYDEKTLTEFYEYWTEPNKNNTKMKFELERTFDIERRLKTWQRNQEKWNSNSSKKTEAILDDF